ncbi:MAG: hypothetical protein AMJ78_01455 [Omnitrophica WOR_2 bacterium SM23_29]|nr:MAG: hypothetical protein AMJ78_01455 [Omnitrophica WOR_2 bacterium SM23_29]
MYKIILSVLLIISLGLIVYSNSLSGELLWDDLLLVKDNIYIRSWTKLGKVFTEDIGAGAATKYNFYRPLQMTTYMIDYSLWGLNVAGYHLTNTLLHILVALSIYWLITVLYDNKLLSFLTATLFVIHPIHTEAVAYISGRADCLATLFILLCLILYIEQHKLKSIGLYLVMLLSYILALLSKEYSLILFALLLLYCYSFEKRLRRREVLPILGISFIYILVRTAALKILPSYTPHNTTLFQRMPGFFVAITDYLRLLISPSNLHVGYGERIFNFGEPKAIFGIVILFLLSFFVFRKRRSNKLVFFSTAWFFITLLPVSNLYPVNAYMAEHWLYLPSIGFFLILADKLCLIYRVKRFRIFTALFIISLLAFYSYLTIRQNGYWKEPIAFYNRTVKYIPDDRRIYDNLGNAYENIGRYEEAIASFNKALEINPNYAGTYYNLGNVYKALGNIEEAVASYKKALQINPKFAEAYNNLGNVYANIGKKEEAIALYNKALEINPDYAGAYYNLGITYQAIGNYEKAMTLYKKALQINPKFAEAYYALGNLCSTIGKYEEAISLYKMALKINPKFAMAHNNLAVAYYYEGQFNLAILHHNKAIELGHKPDPDFLELLRPYRKYK